MTWSPLPDAPPFPADGYAPLADSIGRILGTANDVLLIQGEAVVALEAVATSFGRPGVRALNIVTSLYGRWLGGWLRRAGAEVTDLVAPPGQPIDADLVRQTLAAETFDLVAIVHAESAYGILNPLAEIVAAAKDAGAITVVDAVASVGGHPLDLDALGVDIAVIGPQKALGGQAGVSAISVSDRAWDSVNPQGEAPSILSLTDQKALWIDQGRGALPGTPSALEFHALAATLQRVENMGIPALIRQHGKAAHAARAGVLALMGRNWTPPSKASNLVTAAPLPNDIPAPALLTHLRPGSALTAGVGPEGARLIRLNHTGARATLPTVLEDLTDLAHGLRRMGHDVAAEYLAEAIAAST